MPAALILEHVENPWEAFMSEDVRAHLKSLLPEQPPLSRRDFVAVASVVAGYALAAQPIQAQTAIMTDTGGLSAGMVEVRTSDGKSMPAYFARPAAGSGFATVLVIQEIFGLHEYIKDVCRRLAKLGYLGVAPQVFFRQGDPATIADIQTILREVVGKTSDDQLMRDLDSTLQWAISAGQGDARRLGVTGFCRGGRTTWLYAAHNPNLKAAVAWYGQLVGQPNAMNPRHPIDLVAEIKAPVLGLYGGADQGIPVETVERMKAALQAAGKTAEFVVYPDTPHAFHADYRPSYREAAAKDGWQRMQAWFARYLTA